MPEKLPSYGGQALIEGVLMRGKKYLAAAFRQPNGEIVVQTEELNQLYQGKIAQLPFIRGLVVLWDSLGLGMKYLVISANHQVKEEEKLDSKNSTITVIFSLLISITLFFLLPAAVGQMGENWFGLNHWQSNLTEGLFRLAVLIGYLLIIRRSAEVRRVFAYHGAEHKTINAFEKNFDWEKPEILAQQTTEHPRCGTAFLLTLVLFSVFFFALLGPLPAFWRIISRVVLLPVLVGVTYELLRFLTNHLSSPFVRWLIQPNLWLQKLTTAEPDQEMLEVSVKALKKLLELEKEL